MERIGEVDAKQGVTGHHVRYVLGISLVGVILAFIITALYLGLPLMGDTTSAH